MSIQPIVTDDGSPSFRNNNYDEAYHSKSGAIEESFKKYALPLKIWEKENPVIYDVCFGIGYNAAAAIDVFLEKGKGELKIYCYENDPEILKKALEINPEFKNYELIKNVVDCNQQFVAEFALHDYPITDADILTRGPKAWDDMLNTINICKFNIGSGATGIVTHSFYEALNHAYHRNLYGNSVTEFAHVKRLFSDAWLRIMGMKLFGLRATDYMRVASETDKRYMLFNPIMKMKVAIQGEKVHEHLFDIIAAKGFEKDMYFEQAVSELVGFPKLEGTRHVNMALIAKLIPSYMFMPGQFEEVGRIKDNRNDDFMFHQGKTSGYAKTKFHDYNPAYNSLAHLPNVKVFLEQIQAYKEFLMVSGTDIAKQMMNFDFLLGVGELFTMVAYGHLIIESAKMEGVSDAVMNQMFDLFVRDFSAYAVELYGKPVNTDVQLEKILKMIKRPVPMIEEFEKVLKDEVYSLVDVYKQNP